MEGDFFTLREIFYIEGDFFTLRECLTSEAEPKLFCGAGAETAFFINILPYCTVVGVEVARMNL